MGVDEFKEIIIKYRLKCASVEKDVILLKNRKILLTGLTNTNGILKWLDDQLKLNDLGDDINMICS